MNNNDLQTYEEFKGKHEGKKTMRLENFENIKVEEVYGSFFNEEERLKRFTSNCKKI